MRPWIGESRLGVRVPARASHIGCLRPRIFSSAAELSRPRVSRESLDNAKKKTRELRCKHWHRNRSNSPNSTKCYLNWVTKLKRGQSGRDKRQNKTGLLRGPAGIQAPRKEGRKQAGPSLASQRVQFERALAETRRTANSWLDTICWMWANKWQVRKLERKSIHKKERNMLRGKRERLANYGPNVLMAVCRWKASKVTIAR